MKSRLVFSFLAYLYFWIPSFAARQVSGIWHNATHHITLTVEEISSGIRVLRHGQNQWYFYENYREGQYRDKRGNNYYFLDSGILEWEDYQGKKIIRFTRQGQDPGRNSDYKERFDDDRGHTYVEKNHYYGNKRDFISGHQLEGTWINASTGQMIVIRGKNDSFKVKAHRDGWVTFYRRDRNTFRDHRGNRYDAYGSRITYTSANGDFCMDFIRR